MNKALLLALLSLVSLPLLSQVQFSTGSFEEALQRASAEGKFVWVQFEAATCEQCNEVADKGFESKELATKAAERFVCLKISATHPDRPRVAAAYGLEPEKAFASLFLDANGALLHSFRKTTSRAQEYLQQLNTASDKAGELLNLTSLEKEYRAGNRGFGFLELLLEKRNAVHLPTDSLLEEYVGVLPPDSLTALHTLSFLAQMAPQLDSKADKALRANPQLFNRVWYSLSQPVRVSINNRIIYKGLQKAIREKNEALALRIASFARGTNTNADAAAKAFDVNMLRYFDEVKDTAKYFRWAIGYYERYFSAATPDSIRRLDSTNRLRLLQTAKKDTVREGNRMRIIASIAYAPVAQRFSAELNNGAYAFYRRTENPYLLSMAAEWAKRALEYYEMPDVLDTYAKLLYKQGQKEAGVAQMEKAVALQQQRGYPTKSFEEDLARMRAGARLAD